MLVVHVIGRSISLLTCLLGGNALVLLFTLSSIRLIDGGVAGPLDMCSPYIGILHLVLVCSVDRVKIIL